MPMSPTNVVVERILARMGNQHARDSITAIVDEIMSEIKRATVLPSTAGAPTMTVVSGSPGAVVPVIGTGSIT